MPEASSQVSADSTLPSMLPSALDLAGCANPTQPHDASSPDTGPASQLSKTFANSTKEPHGSRSSTAATPANPSPPPEHEKEKPTPATFGPRWLESFAYFDPVALFWKTSQHTLFLDSGPSNLIWPRWGMTFAGDAFELPMLELLTNGTESSLLLPTPAAQEPGGTAERHLWRKNRLDGANRITPTHLSLALQLLPTPTVGDAASARNATANRTPGSTAHLGETLSDVIRTGVLTAPPSNAGSESQVSPPLLQLTIEDA